MSGLRRCAAHRSSEPRESVPQLILQCNSTTLRRTDNRWAGTMFRFPPVALERVAAKG
jgi:hypothetical protein